MKLCSWAERRWLEWSPNRLRVPRWSAPALCDTHDVKHRGRCMRSARTSQSSGKEVRCCRLHLRDELWRRARSCGKRKSFTWWLEPKSHPDTKRRDKCRNVTARSPVGRFATESLRPPVRGDACFSFGYGGPFDCARDGVLQRWRDSSPRFAQDDNRYLLHVVVGGFAGDDHVVDVGFA